MRHCQEEPVDAFAPIAQLNRLHERLDRLFPALRTVMSDTEGAPIVALLRSKFGSFFGRPNRLLRIAECRSAPMCQIPSQAVMQPGVIRLVPKVCAVCCESNVSGGRIKLSGFFPVLGGL